MRVDVNAVDGSSKLGIEIRISDLLTAHGESETNGRYGTNGECVAERKQQ